MRRCVASFFFTNKAGVQDTYQIHRSISISFVYSTISNASHMLNIQLFAYRVTVHEAYSRKRSRNEKNDECMMYETIVLYCIVDTDHVIIRTTSQHHDSTTTTYTSTVV